MTTFSCTQKFPKIRYVAGDDGICGEISRFKDGICGEISSKGAEVGKMRKDEFASFGDEV